MTIYIWRDTLDTDMWLMGTPAQTGYTAWATMFVDGAYDLFGVEVCDAVALRSPGIPVAVEITVTIREKD